MDERKLQVREYMEKRMKGNPEMRTEYQRYIDNVESRKQSPQMYQRMAVIPLLAIQAIILFVLGTGQAAGGMTTERDEGMVDYLRLTPITPMTKVLGYLFGLPLREWVMFLATLPFMALAILRGGIETAVWLPVALIFFSSVILYHLTGLVSGTVFKSRRWAFLLSMALMFLLYFLVPQGSRFGLPFLRYITMWPVIMEAAPQLFPPDVVKTWQLMSAHVGGAGVEFFDWNFTDLQFTLIVQGSLILTSVVMVWRKWRQADSHLLSKGWAILVFAWLCILPIGNALPGIKDGSLFPAKSIRSLLQGKPNQPSADEALQMCAFYGVVMLFFLVLLVIMLTPSQDGQARGLRRAAKLGRRSAPLLADGSSAFPVVLLLTAGGALSWSWFTRSVLSSTWFNADPGQSTYFLYFGIMAPAILGFHALLEARGGKWPFLAVVFLGVVPVLASLILMTASHDVPTTALIVAGASPMAQTVYAVEHFIPWGNLRPNNLQMHEAIQTSLRMWPVVYALTAVLFLLALRRHWQRRRA